MPDETTKKQRAWLLPGSKTDLRPGLYLVSTPIGNLGDITLRALDTLAAADLVVCEDTRVSGRLLAHYGIEKPLLPYNDHNAETQRGPIMDKIRSGGRVAFISDAGTPLISDPGYKLVRACLEEGFLVTALPGANAPLPALQLSGLPCESFIFIGFLPAKTSARQKVLEDFKAVPLTLVVYETGPRLLESLRDIAAVLGDPEIAVARELTKMYEEVRRGRASELVAHYESQDAPRGEIVLVIGGAAASKMDEKAVRAALKQSLKTLSPSAAAAELAKESGWPRKALYNLALEIGKS